MLLFRLNKDKVVVHPEAAKLVPALKELTEKELRYVVLVYDYYSPLRQIDVEERKKQALVSIWDTTEKDIEKKKVVLQAIDAYRSLQFDINQETLEVYRKKVTRLTQILADDDDSRNISNHVQSIKTLRKEIESLESDILNAEQIVLQGSGELSFIERWQLNRENFLKRYKPAERHVYEPNWKDNDSPATKEDPSTNLEG